MRALVNYNITAITCKNAFDKTPFQVALMGKQRATAGFLLGKQWSRIQVLQSRLTTATIIVFFLPSSIVLN